MSDDKEIRWVGSSYDDLLAFPKAPRKEAGFQLGKVQAGLDPTDWKPIGSRLMTWALGRERFGLGMQVASIACAQRPVTAD